MLVIMARRKNQKPHAKSMSNTDSSHVGGTDNENLDDGDRKVVARVVAASGLGYLGLDTRLVSESVGMGLTNTILKVRYLLQGDDWCKGVMDKFETGTYVEEMKRDIVKMKSLVREKYPAVKDSSNGDLQFGPVKEAADDLLKEEDFRKGLRKMQDFCVDVVDLFSDLETDMFGNQQNDVTMALQTLTGT